MTSTGGDGAPAVLGSAGEQPKIAARSVERSFGRRGARVQALGPLDLDVSDGEFLSIVGPSGCGKSTLLRIVAGLLRPSAGEVTIERRGSGPTTAMVFQEYAVYPWKKVLDNVRFGLDVAGVPRREANERARSYLARLGLRGWEDAYPSVLSGGMLQRVSIARALAVEPEVLLMDEPFAALDAQLRAVLQEELLALWQADQRTVVFVTHSLEEAVLLGDRVVVMSARPGQLLESVTVPFGRPRAPEIRSTPEFAALQGQLWELLRTEVERHLAESLGMPVSVGS